MCSGQRLAKRMPVTCENRKCQANEVMIMIMIMIMIMMLYYVELDDK